MTTIAMMYYMEKRSKINEEELGKGRKTSPVGESYRLRLSLFGE